MTLARTAGGGALLLLTCLLWLALVATAATLNESDAAGNGLSYAYAMIMTIALWVLLAVLLLVAGSTGAIPAWVGLCALALVPLSGAAAMAAVNLLQGRAGTLAKWPIVVPLLVPLLIILYAVWRYFPALRAAVPARSAHVGVWSAILVLSLLPWPSLLARSRTSAAQQAKVEEASQIEEAQAAARKHQENLAKFRTLTPESSLWDWLQFTTDGNELRDSAFAGIHQLRRRQADAEEMIGLGLDLPMMELSHLDLQITPRFCGIAREFLRKDAESFRPKTSEPAPYAVVAFRIERHLPTIRWLSAHDCDCDAVVAAYENTAHLYPDSPERAQFLATLVQLQRKPNAGTP
jgi:hypothetical protein